MVDRGGMLWLGGQFRGVFVTDPRGTRFRYVMGLGNRPGHNPATDDSVRSIAQDAQGALWLGTDDARLLRYGTGAGPVRGPHRAAAAQRRRAVAAGHGVRAGGAGAALAGYIAGPAEAGSLDAQATPVPVAGIRTSLRSMMIDRNGDLWLGTAGAGALRYSTRQRPDGAPTPIATVTHAISPTRPCTRCCEDRPRPHLDRHRRRP